MSDAPSGRDAKCLGRRRVGVWATNAPSQHMRALVLSLFIVVPAFGGDWTCLRHRGHASRCTGVAGLRVDFGGFIARVMATVGRRASGIGRVGQ